jgi:hypothetical protein
MVDPDEVPDISDCSIGEILTVLLIFVALFSAMGTAPYSSNGYTAVPITLGIAAIALAILSVGRRISR